MKVGTELIVGVRRMVNRPQVVTPMRATFGGIDGDRLTFWINPEHMGTKTERLPMSAIAWTELVEDTQS